MNFDFHKLFVPRSFFGQAKGCRAAVREFRRLGDQLKGQNSKEEGNMRTAKYFLVALMLCVCYCFKLDTAQAQTATGQIAGHISDPSGASVPNADITVTHTATGILRKTESNS